MTIPLERKEYWTPREAAEILRRQRTFWCRAYDLGHVQGYRDGPRGWRYLNAASCRAYASLEAGPAPSPTGAAVSPAALDALFEGIFRGPDPTMSVVRPLQPVMRE